MCVGNKFILPDAMVIFALGDFSTNSKYIRHSTDMILIMTVQRDLRIGILTTLDCPILPIHLDALQKKGIRDLVVICDEKVTNPRDIEIWNTRTGGLVGEYGLQQRTVALLAGLKAPIFFVSNHNSLDCIELIESQGLNVLVNSGTPRKLSPLLLSIVEFGVINVHPGILPKYRGSCAVEWSIFNDDEMGNTVHFMDEGYDSGPIIEIDAIDWIPGATYHQIRSDIYMRSGTLIAKALERISFNEIDTSSALKQSEILAQYWKPIEQDEMNIVMAKIASKKPKE
jgi:methionyl-tRNA formyltransferase